MEVKSFCVGDRMNELTFMRVGVTLFAGFDILGGDSIVKLVCVEVRLNEMIFLRGGV